MKDIKKIVSKYFNEETVAGDVSVNTDDVAMPMRRRRRTRDNIKSVLDSDVILKSKPKEGSFFVVVKRGTKNMRGSQDEYSMYIIDKNGNIIEDYGSHSSVKGAKKFASTRGFSF